MVNRDMMHLTLLAVFTFVLEVQCEVFQPVATSCIYWDKLDTLKNGAEQKIHCMLDENGQMGLVYTQVKLIQPAYCPIFNRHSKNVDSLKCNENFGNCPSTEFYSNEVVFYSACYGNARMTMENDKSSAKNDDFNERTIMTVALVVLAVLAVVGTSALIIGVFRYQKKFPKKIFQKKVETLRRVMTAGTLADSGCGHSQLGHHTSGLSMEDEGLPLQTEEDNNHVQRVTIY